MLHGLGREFNLPGAVALGQALHCVAVFLFPVVEFSNDVDGGGVGRPLAEHPLLVLEVKSEVEVSRGEVRQFLFAAVGEFPEFVKDVLVASFDGTGEGLKPLVMPNQSQLFGCSRRCRLLAGSFLGRSGLGGLLRALCCRSLGLFFLSHVYCF